MKSPIFHSEVERALESLRGIVAGIACDYEISDIEISRLTDWLALHANLLVHNPFKELNDLINQILADGVVEEDEREELLQWCLEFSSPDSSRICDMTQGVRRLHGFLQGIAIDGDVSEAEVRDLQDWLHDYDYVRGVWPFDDVWALIERIMEDGRVTEDERKEVLDYCLGFSEKGVPHKASHDKDDGLRFNSNSPVVVTVRGICDSDVDIQFTGRSFCFTGTASYGKRPDLAAVAEELGAVVKPHVSKKLDYLVIGSLSTPSWIYSTYGRKIEDVKENRKHGATTGILHEDDFLEAARQQAGLPEPP